MSQDIIIMELCFNCERRETICKDEKPTYLDAYKCKYDEAEILSRKILEAFKGGST